AQCVQPDGQLGRNRRLYHPAELQYRRRRGGGNRPADQLQAASSGGIRSAAIQLERVISIEGDHPAITWRSQLQLRRSVWTYVSDGSSPLAAHSEHHVGNTVECGRRGELALHRQGRSG